MGLLLLLKACGVHHLKHILLGVSPPFLLLISKAIDLCIYKLLIARDSHELVGCRLGGNTRAGKGRRGKGWKGGGGGVGGREPQPGLLGGGGCGKGGSTQGSGQVCPVPCPVVSAEASWVVGGMLGQAA